MNHFYRTVWNEITQTCVAVAENAKQRGKRSSGGKTAGPGLTGFGLGFMALEPRILFDGAAVVTALDAAPADSTPPPRVRAH